MSGPALTSARLGEAWPEVSARLRKMLASRGVDSSLNDDIVQEVAVRALDKRVPFTDPADLYRWAATTARHLHIDHLRSDGRTTYDDVLVGVPDTVDVAHAAERRVALGHVLRAMAGLRPGERAAILDSLEEREARSSQALVRRHRARATLRKAVGGVLGAAFAAKVRLRTVSPALRHAAAAAVVTPALVVGAGTAIHRPPAPPERVIALAPDHPPVTRPASRVSAVPVRAAAPAREVRAARAVRTVRPAERRAAPPPPKATTVGPVTHREVPPDKNKGSHACVEGAYEFCSPSLKRLLRGNPL